MFVVSSGYASNDNILIAFGLQKISEVFVTVDAASGLVGTVLPRCLGRGRPFGLGMSYKN